jgi:penicillin-binding protein 2
LKQDYRQRKDYYEYAQEQLTSKRIALLAGLTGGVLFIYLLSFWYLQVVKGDHYSRLSEENRIKTVNIAAPRGAIFDRRGDVLVRNTMSFSVHLKPDAVKNWKRTYKLLARALGTSPDAVRRNFEAAAADSRSFDLVLIADDLSLSAVAFIEARRAELVGVSVSVEDRRYYEGGASGAHMVGYVGEISAAELEKGVKPGAIRGDIVGKAGLERYLDDRLRGEHGYRRVVVNNVGRETGDLEGGVAASSGGDVRTSLDLDLQKSLDLAFGSHVGAGVFLDPRTGEILALASRPGYDPNLFARRMNRKLWRTLVADPRHPLQNRALQSAYSPGSTFKLVVAAAALDLKLITPETRYYCNGRGRFHGRTFRCHHRGGHGSVDLKQALIKSCNVYFYNVGSELGIENIALYARRFGFGSKTTLGLGYEEAGLVPDPEWKQRARHDRWYPSETISVAIGQGPILVTPLQQALMVAAIATDGTLPVPSLIPYNLQGNRPVQRRGEKLNPAILEVIRQAMWGVVNSNGTGWRAKLNGYDVGGKTGTTQVVSAATAGTDEKNMAPEHKDHSWFVGFAPLGDPTVAFAIFVEHGGAGSQAAAPIAREVLQTYFKNKTDRPDPERAMELASGLSVADSRDL